MGGVSRVDRAESPGGTAEVTRLQLDGKLDGEIRPGGSQPLGGREGCGDRERGYAGSRESGCLSAGFSGGVRVLFV